MRGDGACCEKCLHWSKDEGQEDMGEGFAKLGTCHRYAPRPRLGTPAQERGDTEEYDDVNWPATLSDEWCGEFEARPDA